MTKTMHGSFELLGFEVEDKITGVRGVADSVCFDLYGCVQISVRPPGLNKDGEPNKAFWYDYKRLTAVPGQQRRLPLPDFSLPEIGSADKAAR